MKKRNRIITLAIAVGFISIGVTIFLNYAIEPLLQVNEWQRNPTCNDLLTCNNIPINFIARDPSHGNQVVTQIIGTMNVSSKSNFAVNTHINYEIGVIALGPKPVSKIYFLISPKDVNTKDITTQSPDQLLQLAKNNQQLIDLNPVSENQFYRKGYWTMPIPQDLVLVGLILFNDNGMSPTDKTDVVVSVQPLSAENIAQENQDSKISSKTVLGLTWTGVSIAPMLLGADMILRVIFEGGEERKSTSSNVHSKSHESSQV